jgi:phage-related protein
MPALKTVIWVGSSRRDLRAFPEPVKDHMGMPDTSRSAKSKTGRETARRDLELVKQRLREAEHIAKEREP